MTSFLHNFTKRWANSSSNNELNNDISFDYLVKYSGKGGHSDSLPMLVALHGDGDTAENFYQTALDQFTTNARVILIKAPISHELGKVWPYSSTQYDKYGENFSKVIDKLVTQYPTVNKPILFGFSGGGAMAYYQSVKHGDCYSYIFPVSGLLFNDQLSTRLSRPSAIVYAYHGKADEVVPFSAGITARKLLKKKGVIVTFTEFEGGHHGLFTEMKSIITEAIEKKLKNL